MKRIIIALAAVLSVTVSASAQQVKSPADAQKAVDAAKAAIEKKESKGKPAATADYLKLAKAYKDAFSAAMGPALKGVDRAQVAILQGNAKPLSKETVEISGQSFTKEVYEYRNLYFNANNQLALVEVTKEVVANSRNEALAAYAKADELDAKKAKTKEIKAGIAEIAASFMDDAMTAYNVGKIGDASKFFALSAAAKETQPLCEIDTTAVYNTAVTALMVEDTETAKVYLDRCVTIGYYEDGEVFAKLAQCQLAAKDTVAMVKTLEDGFVVYPKNQSILIGLINHYLSTKTDTGRLFELLNVAKENEPNNASLYYVEGNIHKELKEYEAAEVSYAEASKVNPSYEYGFIGCGQMYYDLAVEVSNAAAMEADWKKYDVMMEQANGYLKKSMEPFENAFNISKDSEVRLIIAEYLKNIYFRFRTQDDAFMKNYEKFKEICDTKVLPN